MFTLRSVLPLVLLVGLSLVSAWPGAQSAPPNLVANPGFEDGRDPWMGGFTLVSAPTHSGEAAAALSSSSIASISQEVPAEAGATYQAAAWALKNDPGVTQVVLSLNWYDGDSSPLGTARSSALTTDLSSYRRLGIASATAPPGTRMVVIQLTSFVTEGEGGTIYLDDVSLIMLSGATPTATRTPTATQVTPAGSVTPSPTATSTALPPDSLKINEILVRPAPLATTGAPETAREWIELYNASAEPISLAGCMLDDGEEADVIPAVVIPPGGFTIVAGSIAAFRADYPPFEGMIVEMEDGSLGNGLANGGDNLALRDGTGRVIDALSYGDNRTIFDPPCPTVAAGHSLEREPAGYDTDRASDFIERELPSPGMAFVSTPTVAPPRVHHVRLPFLIKHRR